MYKYILSICWMLFGVTVFSIMSLSLVSEDPVIFQQNELLNLPYSVVVTAGYLLSLIFMAAGFVMLAQLQRYSWVCWAAAILSLPWIPFGTLLGLYFIWGYVALRKRTA